MELDVSLDALLCGSLLLTIHTLASEHTLLSTLINEFCSGASFQAASWCFTLYQSMTEQRPTTQEFNDLVRPLSTLWFVHLKYFYYTTLPRVVWWVWSVTLSVVGQCPANWPLRAKRLICWIPQAFVIISLGNYKHTCKNTHVWIDIRATKYSANWCRVSRVRW